MQILYKGLTKVHHHLATMIHHFNTDVLYDGHNLTAALRELSQDSLQLLCTVHDVMHTLHDQAASGSHMTGSDGDVTPPPYPSFRDVRQELGRESRQEVANMEVIYQLFGNGRMDKRARHYCGLLLSVNTLQAMMDELDKVSAQLQA